MVLEGLSYPMSLPGIQLAAALLAALPQQDAVRVVLDEVLALPVPESFVVVGASGETLSDLVIWGPNEADLAVRAGDRFRRLELGDSMEILGAAFVTPRVLEVASEASLARVSLDTGRSESRRLSGWSPARTAYFNEGAWSFLSVEPAGVVLVRSAGWEDPQQADVLGAQIFGREFSSSLLRTPAPDSWSAMAVIADRSDSTVLVAQMGYPYRVAEAWVAGRREPTVSNGWRPPSDGVWVATVALPVQDMLVQQVVDLRSDRRALVIYDRATLECLRSSEIELPLTLLGRVRSAPGYLLAVRVVRRPEVVVYAARVERPPGDAYQHIQQGGTGCE
jgi:hypothetical protein